MKGIILAGGHGTRLHPITKIINKHHLLVYDKPLIFYAIETLRDAGITDIILTLGDHDTDRFYDLLGDDGRELGVNIDYHYHGKPKGIAYAIYMCRRRIGDEPFVVHLGDNIFCDGLEQQVRCFKNNSKPMVVLKKMAWKMAQNYGVAYIQDDKIAGFTEKPRNMFSEDVVLGAYFLDKTFFKVYEKMEPSGRGEFEITEALDSLRDKMTYSWYGGRWFDCGRFEDLHQAAIWRRNQVRGSA